jgi:hypothetical protein
MAAIVNVFMHSVGRKHDRGHWPFPENCVVMTAGNVVR